MILLSVASTMLAILSTVQHPSVAATEPVIAAVNIMRGKMLDTNDFVRSQNSNNEIRFIGWTARRTIKKGDSIPETAVSPPNAITNRDIVVAEYHEDNIKISFPVIIVNDGAVGDTINVRLANRKRSRAIITAVNKVRLIK